MAKHLRNRVAYTTITHGNDPVTYDQASFFTYDIHGNVDTLLQDYRNSAMDEAGHRFKKIVYNYDLISGKVNHVAYQPGEDDQFYHRYTYDAENRLTAVETSSRGDLSPFGGIGGLWEKDASYQYLSHGPMARTVLGQQKVQGVDYGYSLQGWLKVINGIQPGYNDIALDGYIDGSGNPIGFDTKVARDAYSISLFYFNGDYDPIYNWTPFHKNPATYMGSNYRSLYNGNITAMSVHIPKLPSPVTTAGTITPVMFYNYQYDQLNRIKGMDLYCGYNNTGQAWDYLNTYASANYKERVSYDANGNILKYQRNGSTLNSKPLAMDSLSYYYYAGTNRLRQVRDSVNAANYDEDIDDQAETENYVYDPIGNLIEDKHEGINLILWNVYGKITYIEKTDGTTIDYTYDASGNRISKRISNSPTINSGTTWYVRDATGNVMSTYFLKEDTVKQDEIHLYGSSRIGMWKPERFLNLANPNGDTSFTVGLLGTVDGYVFTRGKKLFELSNHLGNVLVTISDRKQQVPKNDSVISYYLADVVTANDYYPFGMLQPGRAHRSLGAGGGAYRYGFNGKENDNEVKGEGSQQDYGMRVYDPRLGKFLSVDPLTKKYAKLTPYQFASNRPTLMIDLDGMEGSMGISGSALVAPQGHSMIEFDSDGDWIPDYGKGWATGMLLTLTSGFAVLTGGAAYGFIGSASASTLVTTVTSKAVVGYTMYSTAAANVGAFIVELVNPDPNGTPGLEFTQGDEVARGLKLIFKQTAVPLVKPIEKFILSTSKLDYLFGKLKYQNLKGAELEAFANSAENVARTTVEKLIHNQDRAADLARTMDYWGIDDTEEGLSKLGDLFAAGLNGKVVGDLEFTQYGTSVTREISLVFTAGAKKGEAAGTMQISYFYKNGDMSSTPEISSVIAKPFGRE